MTSSWKFKCFIKEYGQCHECQVLSNLWYKTKLSRQWPCWSLRRGFNGLDKDNCKMRREIFKIWDWVPLILEVWQYICYVTGSHCYLGTWRDELTHWGRVTHICVGKLTIIASDNGLSPGRRQAIIWTNTGMFLIEPLRTNFSETLIAIHTFPFKKIHLKMSSGKWRPSCLGLNVLISCWINPLHQDDVILTPLLISLIIVLALNSKYDCTCSVWWVRTSGTKIDIPEVPLSSSQMVVININKESVHQLCLQNQSKWKTVSTEYISWKLSSQ